MLTALGPFWPVLSRNTCTRPPDETSCGRMPEFAGVDARTSRPGMSAEVTVTAAAPLSTASVTCRWPVAGTLTVWGPGCGAGLPSAPVCSNAAGAPAQPASDGEPGDCDRGHGPGPDRGPSRERGHSRQHGPQVPGFRLVTH